MPSSIYNLLIWSNSNTVTMIYNMENKLCIRSHWQRSPKPKWTIPIIICHHDIQYFPLTPLPHSFIIQNTISESDSKSLRQGGGANMNNILLPVDINANLLFLQRISWHHRKKSFEGQDHCQIIIANSLFITYPCMLSSVYDEDTIVYLS